MKRHSNDDKEINYKNTTTDGISNAAFVPQLETNKNGIEQGADLIHVDWKVAAGADNVNVAEIKIDDPQPTTGSLGTRIYHECEGRIEKSIPSITVWHHGACPVMTNGDPNGWIFLSCPHTNIIIYHECEGMIEKSLPRDHRLSSLRSRAMTNGDPKGQIFLSLHHTNSGFFSHYCFYLFIVYIFQNKLPEAPEYDVISHDDLTLT